MTTADSDYNDQIHAFAAVAREFVQLLDGASSVDDLVFALDDLLPRLYTAGSRLAVAAPETVYAEEPAPASEAPALEDVDDVAEPMAESLAELFGEEDGYHILEYFDVGLENYDLEERSLSADLAVMHTVFTEQLGIYDLSAPEYFEESGKGWLQSFEGVWGMYLPFMLAAMNHRIYGTLTTEEIEDAEDAEEELEESGEP